MHKEATRSEGFVAVDGVKGGVIRKRILRPGSQVHARPEEGCLCRIHYVGKGQGNKILDTTRDEYEGKIVGGADEALEFRLFRPKTKRGAAATSLNERAQLMTQPDTSEVPRGLHMAVSSMLQGELSEFLLPPEWHSFSQQEAGEEMLYEVELLGLEPPVPPLPTASELEQQRSEQRRAEEELVAGSAEPTLEENLAAALEMKASGNELFSAGDMKGAKKCYDSAMIRLFHSKESWSSLTDEARASIDAVKAPLYLNRSLCNLELGDLPKALWDIDQALALSPGNAKAHYRRGKVRTAQLSKEIEKEKAKPAVFWDPEAASDIAKDARLCFTRARELALDKNDSQGQHTLVLVEKAERIIARNCKLLQKVLKSYRLEQKALYCDRMLQQHQGQTDAHKGEKTARDEETEVDLCSEMPELEP